MTPSVDQRMLFKRHLMTACFVEKTVHNLILTKNRPSAPLGFWFNLTCQFELVLDFAKLLFSITNQLLIFWKVYLYVFIYFSCFYLKFITGNIVWLHACKNVDFFLVWVKFPTNKHNLTYIFMYFPTEKKAKLLQFPVTWSAHISQTY